MDTDCIKLSPETPIGLLVMSNRSSSCLFLIKAFLALLTCLSNSFWALRYPSLLDMLLLSLDQSLRADLAFFLKKDRLELHQLRFVSMPRHVTGTMT